MHSPCTRILASISFITTFMTLQKGVSSHDNGQCHGENAEINKLTSGRIIVLTKTKCVGTATSWRYNTNETNDTNETSDITVTQADLQFENDGIFEITYLGPTRAN